jgi:pyrroloquinoline quinone biosynthesis protein D
VNDRALVGEGSVPRFVRGARLHFDKHRDRWIVQAPERLFVLDPIALEILQRCDGAASVSAIVDDLAAKFTAAPREQILRDVGAMLQDFADKGVMSL